jgi:hypothetical protein
MNNKKNNQLGMKKLLTFQAVQHLVKVENLNSIPVSNGAGCATLRKYCFRQMVFRSANLK